MLHEVLYREDTEYISGGFVIKIEIVVGRDPLVRDGTREAVFSAIVCGGGERPAAKFFMEAHDMFYGCVGGFFEIIPLIDLIIDGQPETTGRIGDDLPNTPRIFVGEGRVS